MGGYRKLLGEVNKALYEKKDNDAKAFRFEKEEDSMVKRKIKYLERHLRNALLQEKSHADQIRVYGNLGLAYFKLGDFQLARKNFDTQLEMAMEFKDEHAQRMAYGNLGVLNKLEWKLKEALECYQQSLDIAIKHNNRYGQGRLYNNMANLLELQMDFERAIEYHKLHLEIATDMNDRDGIVKSCGSISALYHTIEDLPNAVRFLEQLMDQLRKNLRVLDTLADDASDSDDGGYINIEGDDASDNEKEANPTGIGGKGGKFAKLKDKIKRKK